MNNCEYDILNNQQRLKQQVEYAFNKMEAHSDIGRERKRQEDGVLIVTHNNNHDFRLIAVADGMGGELGAYASNLVLYNLMDWFQNLNTSAYQLEQIDSLIPVLYGTDKEIRNRFSKAGTTIALAIKGMNTTYTLNIGDTRIYLKNQLKLKQISTDHNYAWDLYQKGEISTKNDIRFHKKSNLLTARLGCEKEKIQIAQTIIKNYDYDDIYIFSDGITDCIGDKELEQLTNQQPKDILKRALTNISFCSITDDDYYDRIEGGKDNASIAVLRK